MVCLYIFGNYMVDGLKKNTVFIYTDMGHFKLTEANVYTPLAKAVCLIVMLLAPLVILRYSDLSPLQAGPGQRTVGFQPGTAYG